METERPNGELEVNGRRAHFGLENTAVCVCVCLCVCNMCVCATCVCAERKTNSEEQRGSERS